MCLRACDYGLWRLSRPTTPKRACRWVYRVCAYVCRCPRALWCVCVRGCACVRALVVAATVVDGICATAVGAFGMDHQLRFGRRPFEDDGLGLQQLFGECHPLFLQAGGDGDGCCGYCARRSCFVVPVVLCCDGRAKRRGCLPPPVQPPQEPASSSSWASWARSPQDPRPPPPSPRRSPPPPPRPRSVVRPSSAGMRRRRRG